MISVKNTKYKVELIITEDSQNESSIEVEFPANLIQSSLSDSILIEYYNALDGKLSEAENALINNEDKHEMYSIESLKIRKNYIHQIINERGLNV